MAVNGKLHAPSALLTGIISNPFYRRLVWTKRSGCVRKILPATEFDSLTNQTVARHYTNYVIPTHNTIHKRGQGINSNLLYRSKAERCGLNISASCEHGNEMAGRFLFYLEKSQLLNKDSVRWRQLVKAICCASHRSLLCHLSQNHSLTFIFGFGFITNIFCIECLYVTNRMFPSFGDYGFGSWEVRSKQTASYK